METVASAETPRAPRSDENTKPHLGVFLGASALAFV
jgi:hypothetical protein